MADAYYIENERLPATMQIDRGEFRATEWYYTDGVPNALAALAANGLPGYGMPHPFIAGISASKFDPRRGKGGRYYIRIGYESGESGSFSAMESDRRVVAGYTRTDTSTRHGSTEVNHTYDGKIRFGEPALIPTTEYLVRFTKWQLAAPDLGFLESKQRRTNSDTVKFPNLFGMGQPREFEPGTLSYLDWGEPTEVQSVTKERLLRVTHTFLAGTFESTPEHPFQSFMDHSFVKPEPILPGGPTKDTFFGPFQVLDTAEFSEILKK